MAPVNGLASQRGNVSVGESHSLVAPPMGRRIDRDAGLAVMSSNGSAALAVGTDATKLGHRRV
jgi:hypothetical protein